MYLWLFGLPVAFEVFVERRYHAEAGHQTRKLRSWRVSEIRLPGRNFLAVCILYVINRFTSRLSSVKWLELKKQQAKIKNAKSFLQRFVRGLRVEISTLKVNIFTRVRLGLSNIEWRKDNTANNVWWKLWTNCEKVNLRYEYLDGTFQCSRDVRRKRNVLSKTGWGEAEEPQICHPPSSIVKH